MSDNILLMDSGLKIILSVTFSTLVFFLAIRELAQVIHSKTARRMAYFITGPIVSLLILFIAIIAISLNSILS